MSSRAELKQKAKDLLDGKKGKAALMVFIYSIMPFLFTLIPLIGPVVNIICMPVLTYGLLKALIDLKNGEEVGAFDFFTKGFKDFGKVWGVSICTALKMWGPLLLGIVGYILMTIGVFSSMASSQIESSSSICLIIGWVAAMVSGIWAIPITWKYMYSMNELAYDSSRKSMDIVNTSGSYLIGNRWKAFVLDLSFIGWFFLVGITFGLITFWLLPYMLVTKILFYEELSGRNEEPLAEPGTIKTEE